jgi:hypothetical protein
VLGLLASFCVWTKTLVCNNAVNRDFTIQSDVRRFCLQEINFLVSSSDDRATPSGRSAVNRFSRLDDVPYRPDARQTSIIRPDDVFISSGPHTVSRSFCASLHPSGRLSSPFGRPLVIDQLQILSKFRIREVDISVRKMLVSRPDARLHKARIAIQISRSGRQSALVRTRMQLIWKLPIRLQQSGRALCRYGNYVLKFSRPDVPPPWSRRAKPYMEVICSGHATVRTTVSHRPDAALKQERFSENSVTQLFVRTTKVHHPDGVRTKHSSRPFCTSAYK